MSEASGLPEQDPRTTATKPSWKTGEFWLQLAAIVLPLLLGSQLIPPDSVWMRIILFAISVLGALGFTAVKGAEKRQAIRTAGDVAIAEAQKPVPEKGGDS